MYVSNNFFDQTEEFRFFQIQLISITSKLIFRPKKKSKLIKNYFNNKIDGKKKRKKKLYEKIHLMEVQEFIEKPNMIIDYTIILNK